MGQVIHGSATTTHAVRAAIQRSQATIVELAGQYDLNPKTVMKMAGAQDRRRQSHGAEITALDGLVTGGRGTLRRLSQAHSPAARRLPLRPAGDDPAPARSSLHRLFQRHDISRLPEIEGERTQKAKFKPSPIGYFHIVLEARLRHDITKVRTEEGKLYMFVAMDRTSKYAFVELHEKANRAIASAFLGNLIAAIPYKIHTVLTDNGVQFCHMPQHRDGPTAQYSMHMFDRVCRENGIEHRLTMPNHPWTNGQVERMNRTLKGKHPVSTAGKVRRA